MATPENIARNRSLIAALPEAIVTTNEYFGSRLILTMAGFALTPARKDVFRPIILIVNENDYHI